MKLKPNLENSTQEFWYDIQNGYLKPEEMLEDDSDIKKVLEAIRVLQEFESSCEDQIEGFMQ